MLKNKIYRFNRWLDKRETLNDKLEKLEI